MLFWISKEIVSMIFGSPGLDIVLHQAGERLHVGGDDRDPLGTQGLEALDQGTGAGDDRQLAAVRGRDPAQAPLRLAMVAVAHAHDRDDAHSPAHRPGRRRARAQRSESRSIAASSLVTSCIRIRAEWKVVRGDPRAPGVRAGISVSMVVLELGMIWPTRK